MTVTLARDPTQTYADFTSITALDQAATWPATTAERLIVIIASRAYTGGATRALTVTWGGTIVPVVGTNFTTPAVAAYDACYWVGELAAPSAAVTQFRVQTDAATRGLHCVGLFVNGAKSLNAARILDAMARGTSGNTVNLGGTPNMIGSLLAVSTIIAQATTVASFSPSGWTTVQSGLCGPAATATATIRHATTADTAAVATATQFGAADVQRGGVLVEIQAEPAAAYGVTEAVTPADSVGPLVVAVAMDVTEALTAGDGSSLSVPSNTSPENPVGVWTGAAASWKLPSGADAKGVNTLTASGLSAASIKGPGATFTTASYARRTAPALGSPSNLTVEFWCKPTTFGGLWYLGPRVSGANSARIWIDTAGAWNVSRTTSAGTQSGKSANGAAVVGQTYHVAAVLASGADHKLYANGEAAALTMTGAAVTGAFAVGSDDEVALGLPTLPSLGGFAGDIGRVTVWPIAMSASRIRASYRQQNSLDEWTGLSGENSVSDTNRAPAAVPVHVDMTSGVGQTIDVIGRAYDPDGDALSIQGGSLAPSTGAASIVGDQVFWTPPASFTGAATCALVVRDGGGKTSSSKVYATVAAPPSVITRPKIPDAVAASRQWWIGGGGPSGSQSPASWAAAKAAAAAGDHIYLPAGSTALGTLSDSYPAATPLVIRGRPMAAGSKAPTSIISGKTTVSGSGYWLYEVQTNYSGSTRYDGDIAVTGSYVTVTRCWLTGREGIDLSTAAHHVWLGWNRFTGRNTRTGGTDAAPTAPNCFQLYVKLPAGNAAASAYPHDLFFYRNLFWDDTDHSKYPTDPPTAGGKESMNCYIGDSHPVGAGATGRLTNVIFEENFFPGPTAGLGRPRSIYVKRGCSMIRNRSTHAYGVFGQRHGWGSKIYGNRVTDPDFVVIGDERAGGYANGNDIRNNVAGSAIKLYRASHLQSGAPYQAADWTTLFANQGNVTVGFKPGNAIADTIDGGTVSNVRIYQNTPAPFVDPTHADAATITVNAGNPLGLTNGADLISATFADAEVGFEVAGQGL